MNRLTKKITDKNYKRFFFVPDEKGRVHLVDTQVTPRLVDPVDSNNITFYVFTPNNKEVPIVLKPHELDILYNSPYYDPSFPNFFTTHGWTGTYNSESVIGAKDAILSQHEVNVFCVDWSGPAQLFYTLAVLQVNPVGDIIGEFINQVANHYSIDLSSFSLMGHSLGGQLIARIGYYLNGKIGFIIALDPAYPSFPYEPDNLAERLDSSDAEFVQVIHTNSGFLGYPYSIGDADYHPNGGVKQAGCGPDLIGTCSHFVVKDMIPESFSTGGYISRRCTSFEDYIANRCAGNDQSYFGGWPIDTR